MSASIGRAFTRRTRRPEASAPMPRRNGQVKYSTGTIRRNKISAPVELLSSTNMLAYTAPDLHSNSSSSSLGSGDDETDPGLTSTLTSPSLSSLEPSPVGPEPNHLSTFFPKRSATVTSTARSSTSSTGTDVPSVPKRALSHTKKSHQELARKRSISRMSPPPSSLTPTTVRRSQDFFQPISEHPFSRELDKVNEVAEDFGSTRVLEEEEQILLNKGLKKISAEEYISEIEELYGGIFEDQLGPLGYGTWF